MEMQEISETLVSTSALKRLIVREGSTHVFFLKASNLVICFMLAPYLANSSTMKMEARNVTWHCTPFEFLLVPF
jgi:hypothetical protein